jgi:DNA-binding SARP family transcriptional activator
MAAGSQLARGTRDRPVSVAVRLELLKGFALSVGGEPVWLPMAAQRLLTFLALQERPVHRLFVAGNLWTYASEERATAALRTTLWRLGRTASGTVSVGDHTLALSPGTTVDVHVLSEIARRIIQGSDEQSDEESRFLSAAGQLLPDWYDDWVLIERERFRQLRVHALEALCATLTARGRFAEAADAGLAAVAVEPLRESAHRALIAVYLAEGNPGEALRQYEIFRNLLAIQLHLTPTPVMESLVDAVRKA